MKDDTAALTDEELAEMEERHAAVEDSYAARRPAIDHINNCHASVNDVPRLIANLRAARSQLTEARQDAREEYARAEQAEQELQRLRGTEMGNRQDR